MNKIGTGEEDNSKKNGFVRVIIVVYNNIVYILLFFVFAMGTELVTHLNILYRTERLTVRRRLLSFRLGSSFHFLSNYISGKPYKYAKVGMSIKNEDSLSTHDKVNEVARRLKQKKEKKKMVHTYFFLNLSEYHSQCIKPLNPKMSKPFLTSTRWIIFKSTLVDFLSELEN